MSDPIEIYNWRRLDGRITTSGQPTEAQLADLQRLGVTHVINLGLHTHEKAASLLWGWRTPTFRSPLIARPKPISLDFAKQWQQSLTNQYMCIASPISG